MQSASSRATRVATTTLSVVLSLAARDARAQHVTIADPTQTGYVNLSRSASVGNTWLQAAGETFHTPNASAVTLASWSFWLNAYAAFDLPTVPVQLEIVEWSGSGPVGGPLFTSAPVTPADPVSELATFHVGLSLDPAKTYIAMAVPGGGGPAIGVDGFLFDDAGHFAGGNFVYFETSFDQNTKTYRSLLDQPSIDTNVGDFYPVYATYDATFRATFDGPVTATPEPATIAFVFTGFGGLAVIVRRRRRR